MSTDEPRRSAGPAPRRAAGPVPSESPTVGRHRAMAAFAALAAILGFGLFALGMVVLMDRDMFTGVLVASMGGILGAIGVVGLIVGAVLWVRGAPPEEDQIADDELGIGTFVEEEREG